MGRCGSDGPLVPLLTEGGWWVQPTEEQFKFNWKQEAVRKKLQWWGKIKRGGKLTVTAFFMQLTSRGWQWRDLIPLVN